MMALNKKKKEKKRNKANALALVNRFFIHNWSLSVVNQKKAMNKSWRWIFLDSTIYGDVSLLF